MAKLIIPKLDMHVSDACNLHCEQCDHFSDLNFQTIFTPKTLREWCEPWKDKILPQSFHILGGEPLMNDDIEEIVYLMREMWPESDIVLWTNGLLAKKFPNLPKVLKETKTRIQVSNHSTIGVNSEAYDRKFNDCVEVFKEWYEKYEVPTTIQFNNGQHVTFGKQGDNYVLYGEQTGTGPGGTLWEKVYHGYGRDMKPFNDGDPQKSWEICTAKCPQLYNGRIHKCGRLTFLPLVKEKIGLSEEWNHYLTYEGLKPTCSETELKTFFNLGAESHCGMCPAEKTSFLSKHNPFKIYNLKLIT